jgi:hypothetical protein
MSGPNPSNRFSVFDIGRAPAFPAGLAAVVVDQGLNDTKQVLRDEDGQFLP